MMVVQIISAQEALGIVMLEQRLQMVMFPVQLAVVLDMIGSQTELEQTVIAVVMMEVLNILSNQKVLVHPVVIMELYLQTAHQVVLYCALMVNYMIVTIK
jgi:hypothetical protein